MKKVHTTFPEKAKDLWETWDIRVFILCSLAIQALLTFLAPLRKNSSSSILRFIIWLLYLTADAVGIFVIGLISSNEGDYVHKQELLAFWAPFLLLHLGGPDTITALALEDNELWNRHALQLATQLVITIYVFVLTFRKKDNHLLIFPTMLMLVDGLIKYIERTCALFFASEDSFRDSLVGTPEPGPNYARLMEEYFSAKGAHIPTDFEGKDGLLGGETRPEETDARNNEEQPTDTAINDGQVCKEELKPEEKIVREAHQHYEMFKALLADGFLSLKDRKASRNFFMLKEIKDAVKIIEIELNLIYDVFYTKSYLLQRKRACFRVLCFFSAIASLVYFSVKMSKRKYHTVDVVITFVLLGGAIVLDVCAAVMFVLSDWWIILIPFDGNFKIYFKKFMLWTIRWSRRTRRINSSRWSESISGYNLLRRCFREPPSFFNYRIFSSIKTVRDLLIEFLYVQDRKADKEIIEYVVGEIKSKAEHATELDVAKEVCSARGNLVLDNDNFLTSEILNPWTLEVDYDESLLIWHLATDFCYWTNSETEAQSEHCRYSKALSDYMSYILLRQQTMVSSVVGMADTRFEDTSADAKKFINNKSIKVSWLVEWGWMAKKWCCGCCASGTTQDQKETTPELEEKKFFKDFCKKVLEVKADVQPIIAKGDKSKSVLFDACRLAKQLDMFGESKWEIISKVWVELLCYAAVRCSPRSHIARLSKGGELITLVWLYMAHLGLGERFLQNQGFGWTKLIIQK